MAVRLGGPVFGVDDDPDRWVAEHVRLGYRAAYCPDGALIADTESRSALTAALARADIALAEVGAWVNPVDTDEAIARANRTYLAERLALADELGAGCCVDIIGSASPIAWDGADARGYSEDFFSAVVDAFRDVIDAASPRRTVMAFEAMPYYFLDGPDEYERLLRAIDRPGKVGVHVDLCNMITSPRRYYRSGELAREVFRLLGGSIVSCHLKDLSLDDAGGTVKFFEVMPGTGGIDIAAYLREAASVADCPVMLEHLPDESSYDLARTNVRRIADAAGIPL